MRRSIEVQSEVTVIIKTFERPSCLRRLVKSIRKYYQVIPIIVVDDSTESLSPVWPEITEYYHLPFDSGLSFGRNYALTKVRTKYLLLSDDDMVFGEKTDLRKMYRVLETTGFSIVACNWVDHVANTKLRLGINRFESTTEIKSGEYRQYIGETRGALDGFPLYDVVHNFFMADRRRVGVDPWDEKLKIGNEHADFFLSMKAKGALCTKLDDVFVFHYPRRVGDYARYRRRESDYFPYFAGKHGVDRKVVIGARFDSDDRALYYHSHLYRRARVALYALLARLAHRFRQQ